jgi:hypothetical protein
VELQNYEVWIAGKIVTQTGSKLHLDPDPSCFNLDPDPSSFNLGLGTYCTLPSKILYNPNNNRDVRDLNYDDSQQSNSKWLRRTKQSSSKRERRREGKRDI